MANAAAQIPYNVVQKSTCPGYDKEVQVPLKDGPAKSPLTGNPYVMPSCVNLAANLKEAARIGHVQKAIEPGGAVGLSGAPILLPLESLAEAALMSYIYTLFDHGGKYDYQRTPCHEFVKDYVPFTSFHFGLFMATARFPLMIVLAGSGFFNMARGRPHDRAGTFGNSVEDEANLKFGFKVYQENLLAIPAG
jgi:hypothetical protein